MTVSTVGAPALIDAKAPAVLITIGFVPWVQMSTKWKKAIVYSENRFDLLYPLEESRIPQDYTDHTLKTFDLMCA